MSTIPNCFTDNNMNDDTFAWVSEESAPRLWVDYAYDAGMHDAGNDKPMMTRSAFVYDSTYAAYLTGYFETLNPTPRIVETQPTEVNVTTDYMVVYDSLLTGVNAYTITCDAFTLGGTANALQYAREIVAQMDSARYSNVQILEVRTITEYRPIE